jgi:hypothetical protein
MPHENNQKLALLTLPSLLYLYVNCAGILVLELLLTHWTGNLQNNKLLVQIYLILIILLINLCQIGNIRPTPQSTKLNILVVHALHNLFKNIQSLVFSIPALIRLGRYHKYQPGSRPKDHKNFQ